MSHWHRDHTGGLLSFLELRKSTPAPCVVDVHPDRPIARGIAPGPKFDNVIATLPPDPTFELIEKGGGMLEKHREGHFVAGGTVWVSGEIPRITEYESGLLGSVKWVEENGGKWVSDQVRRRAQIVFCPVADKEKVDYGREICCHRRGRKRSRNF